MRAAIRNPKIGGKAMHHIFMRTGACALAAALVLMMSACSSEVIDEPDSTTGSNAVAATGEETLKPTQESSAEESTDVSGTEEADASTAPAKTPVQDKQEALRVFNSAANAVKTEKPAMKKERYTKFIGFEKENEFLQKALEKANVIPKEDPVNFPKGTNYDALYPMFHYAWASKLSMQDIQSISCQESGSNYSLHIDMPDELIPTNTTDYSKYKHGRAMGVITGTEIKKMMGGDDLTKYDQLYSKCSIDAVVNKTTGQMVKATYVLNFKMTISGKVMGIPLKNLSVSLQITEIYSF